MKLDNESVLREILEQSLAGYWDWDIPSGDEYMSPSFKKMFGYEDHEIPNRADSWQKLIFSEDLPGVFDVFNKHVKSKGATPYYNKVRYRHKNGSTVWVICTGKIIEWNSNGEPLRMVGCHIDITESKRYEEELKTAKIQAEKNEDFLNQTGKMAKVGGWEINLIEQKLTWTNEVYRIHEVDSDYIPTVDKAISFYDAESAPIISEAVNAAITSGKPFDVELGIVTAKGNHRNVRALGNIKTGESGNIDFVYGTFQDITERKAIDAQLIQSQLILRSSLESLKDVIVISIDKNYKYLYFNETHKGAMKSAYGKDVSIGMNLLDCITSEKDRHNAKTNFDRAMLGESHTTIQEYGDANRTYYESRYNPIRNEDKEIIGITVFALNITERKRTEKELKDSVDLLSNFIKIFPINALIKKLGPEESRAISSSENYKDMIGVPGSLMVGKKMNELFPKESAIKITADDWKTISEDKITQFEETPGDQNYITIKVPILQENRHLLAEYAIDVSERKLAEKILSESEALFQAAFLSAPYALSITDPSDGTFLQANEQYANMTGYSIKELMHTSTLKMNLWVDLTKRDQLIDELKRNGNFRDKECEFRRKNGDPFNALVSGTLVNIKGKPYFLALCIDVTERKKTEEALNNAQKLESLGVLAGGIAHDFNNLLGGIYGYMDIASGIATDSKLHNYISKAMTTIDRGRHLTQQLLTFAKGGAPIKSVANLFPHVSEIVEFALSGSNITSTFDIADNLHACNFDKNQIAQVIDNIIINAKQAMPDGGKIEISAQNYSVKQGQHAFLGHGEYIMISIRDHGIGMPKEILTRIFDPFYTTKTTGHGLGLATSYSIIKRHNGCIEVESEPGKGSTFYIFLPAETNASEVSKESIKIQHKGSGCFIVMDDEEIMRETITSMLESFGYNVIIAEDGQKAVDILASEIAANRTIAGLILDLTIPGGMGGKEAINEIRKISVKIPVFVASGYAEDPVMANPKDYGFMASICKPFRRVELSELLIKHMRKAE